MEHNSGFGAAWPSPQIDASAITALNSSSSGTSQRGCCINCTARCVPSRQGVQLMQQPRWDVPLLEELSAVMADASICGLGQAAPNPLLCAI